MDTIIFDARNLEDCERVIAELKAMIWRHHGSAVVRRLFLKATPSKRSIKGEKNLAMMAKYFRSGLSVQRFAAMFAEKTRTNPQAVDKHIRREKKRIERRLGRGSIEALKRATAKRT